MKTNAAILLALGCCLCTAATQADEACPPGHEVLVSSWWGGICYIPSAVLELKQSVGESALETTGGPVKVTTSSGRHMVTYATRVFRITEQIDSVSLDAGGAVFSMRLGGGDGLLTMPRDEVRFRATADGVVVSGARGTVTATSRMGSLTITSAAGTTQLSSSAGNVARTGPPPASHPYMNRGLLIGGPAVAVYISFDSLFGDNGPKLEWITVRSVP